VRLLAWDDIAETALALFHQVHCLFVLKDARVSFESLDFRCPLDEVVLFKAFDREVN